MYREISPGVVNTQYWHPIDDKRIQCDLCPHFCQLKEGQRGLCFIRANQNAKVVLTSYGRSSGFCVDPIEKKPLNHFFPGSSIFSFGTAGCNLSCKFCQNWDMSKSREMDILAARAGPEELAKTALQRGCRSMAYTYNDPVIFLEYAVDVAQACAEVGVHSVAVSAAYINSPAREDFFRYMQAANIDLKAFSETFYRRLTGGHLQVVLDSLEYLVKETQIWLELTCLLIPGENDTDAELEAMTQWIVEHLGNHIPIHFTAFHPAWKMTDKPRTPLATLQKARNIALAGGLLYAYTGNVRDITGSTTWCTHCNRALIVRDGYSIVHNHLTSQSCCPYCGTQCAGIFS
ncbi:AmmeMemoRadiSam system radical SAM enzyme [Candidatus Venteria ishoeyi]|uniref:4-hydroxyphenylacetate decarboxylase activating enzyme n=1 Tax=Candidatus Venteria ishoeyi TaxID=1899563 RepID=A0A1H6FA79_9GAMM|nr:AmmeMemoRadiSam system radical SAM enzyme [Candidatus Venteria ishoeyi]SEH06998.1 4-hydroxyphenylacetate decarboxylase activating enzyme [Candidatus Venteria ishoeyi]